MNQNALWGGDSMCFDFKLQRKVPSVYMKILSVGIFIKSHALNTR